MHQKRFTVRFGLAAALLSPLAIWFLWWQSTKPLATVRPATSMEPSVSAKESSGPHPPTDANDPVQNFDRPVLPRVDFSGQWQLDRQASEPLDPLLKAHGVSDVTRALIDKVPVAQIITQTDDELTIEVKSGFLSGKEKIVTTGQRYQRRDFSGEQLEMVSFWSADGMSLITQGSDASQKEHLQAVRCRGEDEDSMEVRIEYTTADGKTLTNRRVFRRVK